MLKHRISDIYKDGSTLFSSNPMLNDDDRFAEFVQYFYRFDLIAKYDFGAREIFTQFLDEEELDYVLLDIQEAIYMCFLKNEKKYKAFFSSDAVMNEIVPSDDYRITRQYGEEEKHFNYGARSATDSFTQKINTSDHGQQQTTDVLGQAQQTVTTAPRTTTSQDQRTTFDSQNDYDTTKNTLNSVQTIDTTVDASRTNTSTDASYTDTLTEGAHSVTKTDNSHSDGVVYEEHIDNVYGYKGNPTSNVEKYKEYWNDNLFKMIVTDCINTVTYSIYLCCM